MTTEPPYPIWLSGVLEQYREAVELVDRAMPKRLRRVYEAEDFVQWAICEMLEGGYKYDLEKYDPKISIVIIAKRRIIDVLRKRQVRTQHVSLTRLLLEADLIHNSWRRNAEKRPDETIELRDLIEYVVFRMCDPEVREYIILRSQGYFSEEAASMVGMNVRTVQRKLEALRSVALDYIGYTFGDSFGYNLSYG